MCLRASWALYPSSSLVEPRNRSLFSKLSFIAINIVSFSPYWFVSGSLPVWWLSDTKEVLFWDVGLRLKNICYGWVQQGLIPVLTVHCSTFVTKHVCFLQRPEVEKRNWAPHPRPQSYHASFHHLLILELEDEGRGEQEDDHRRRGEAL